MRQATQILLVILIGALAPISIFAETENPTPDTNRKYLPICTLVKVPPKESDRKAQMKEAAALGASRKMMAELYDKCQIDIEFFTHMIKNASDRIRLDERQGDNEKLLQEQAEAACNFKKELGVRGATQVIDYSNELATRMCNNGPAQGCSTLCKPASFSIVNIKDQPITSFVRTSLHEFFHSNCCGRACLNQEGDGTGTRFGFDIVIANADSPKGSACYHAAGANSGPGAPDTATPPSADAKDDESEAELEKYQAALGIEVETALQAIRAEVAQINPAAMTAVCNSMKLGSGKNPGNIKYDKDKAFFKYYGGKEARHLAKENARDMGQRTGLPKNLLPSLGEDPAVVAALNAAKGKGRAGQEALDAAIAASEAGKALNKFQRLKAAGRLKANLKSQQSRVEDADSLQGKAPEILETGEGGESQYTYQSPDKKPKKKNNEPSAEDAYVTNASPANSGSSSTSVPSAGASNLFYASPDGRTPAGAMGLTGEKRPKGGTRGQNDAIILQQGRNGGTFQQREEDHILRTDPAANRKPENREINPGYE